MTVRMRAVARDAWADALESGEYQQASGGLRNANDGLCCLGVLCEVAIAAGVNLGMTWPEDEDEDGFVYYGDQTTYLPGRVIEWAGLPGYDPQLTDPESGATLSASVWNDDHAADFAQIARMVRAITALDES